MEPVTGHDDNEANVVWLMGAAANLYERIIRTSAHMTHLHFILRRNFHSIASILDSEEISILFSVVTENRIEIKFALAPGSLPSL